MSVSYSELKTEDDFALLEQELAIADVCPKKNKTDGKVAKSKDYLYCMTRETQDLVETCLHEANERLPHWKSQVQVCHWANHNLRDEWHVFVARDQWGIPLYFFILNARVGDRVEMKGLWKSLVGSLHYLKDSSKTWPAGASAYDLIQYAMVMKHVPNETMVYVAARIGLERLFAKRGIQLQYVEKKIPKRQGASVQAQFEWKLI